MMDAAAFVNRLPLALALLGDLACAPPAPAGNQGEDELTTESPDSSSSAQSDGAAEESASEASTTAEDDGSVFSPVDDLGDGCGFPCDPFAPNDCPEGQKCTASTCAPGVPPWDANVCVEVEGDKAPGEPCAYLGDGIDGRDECAAGSICYEYDDETGLGICVAFCTGSADAPVCEGGYCVITASGTRPLCLPYCDLLAQDCPFDQNCIASPSQDGPSCVLGPGTGGFAPYGTPCDSAVNCNEGLMCAPAPRVPAETCDPAVAQGCCSPYCEVGGPDTCPGDGQICEPLYPAGSPAPGAELFGVCVLP